MYVCNVMLCNVMLWYGMVCMYVYIYNMDAVMRMVKSHAFMGFLQTFT